jgi:hypothetical protein
MEDMKRQLTASYMFLRRCHKTSNFIDMIIVVEEIWLRNYEPESKRHISNPLCGDPQDNYPSDG